MSSSSFRWVVTSLELTARPAAGDVWRLRFGQDARELQSDLDFLNSLSLNPTSTVSSASAPPTFELSPFSDLPTTATGELDLSALDEADVDDLLRRMDEAESAADGLEGQLDNLLGTLDGMLDVLGAGDDEVAPPEEEAKPNGKVVGVDESTEKEIVADGKDTKA